MRRIVLAEVQGKISDNVPQWKDFLRQALCLFLIAFAGLSVSTAAQDVQKGRGVLDPEDANEARLNLHVR